MKLCIYLNPTNYKLDYLLIVFCNSLGLPWAMAHGVGAYYSHSMVVGQGLHLLVFQGWFNLSGAIRMRNVEKSSTGNKLPPITIRFQRCLTPFGADSAEATSRTSRTFKRNTFFVFKIMFIIFCSLCFGFH